ncbi:MAG: acyl-CoA dehydrogenase, partial [Proteobacteria bacterium]|nr:acyl-CoA dehydrogenase [Pseudomonadota bacterium]
MASELSFSWEDPFLFDEQLTEEERLIRDTARQFADDKLMPRIVEANRNEVFDPMVMKE